MNALFYGLLVAAGVLLVSGTLLDYLKLVHSSDTFKHLAPADQILIIELIAEAEAGELKTYIDTVGFHNVLAVIDKLPPTEAHALTALLMQELQHEEHTNMTQPVGKRDLVTVLNAARNNSAFQHLSPADQQIVLDVLRAAENGSLTHIIQEIGYSTVLGIIDMLPVTEKHVFERYLIQHLQAEALG